MEQEKKDLILRIAKDQKEGKKLEDSILQSLANSETNILDDKNLISQLDESKIVAQEIQVSLKQNEVASIAIEETRSRYACIADRGALLYFVI